MLRQRPALRRRRRRPERASKVLLQVERHEVAPVHQHVAQRHCPAVGSRKSSRLWPFKVEARLGRGCSSLMLAAQPQDVLEDALDGAQLSFLAPQRVPIRAAAAVSRRGRAAPPSAHE